MDSMKKMRAAAVAAGILTLAAFVVLAAGGTNLPQHVSLIAFVCFLGGMIASLVIDGKRRDLAARIQASKPVATDMATIMSRRVRHGYRLGTRGGHVSCTDMWCLTFDTAKHGQIELAVPYDVWERYSDGVRGELRFKGKQFVRFMKR